MRFAHLSTLMRPLSAGSATRAYMEDPPLQWRPAVGLTPRPDAKLVTLVVLQGVAGHLRRPPSLKTDPRGVGTLGAHTARRGFDIDPDPEVPAGEAVCPAGRRHCSHSRFFWGLRLHLVCTLSGLPVAFALAGAKADEREVLLGMLDADPNLVAAHPNQKLMADKNYYKRHRDGKRH